MFLLLLDGRRRSKRKKKIKEREKWPRDFFPGPDLPCCHKIFLTGQ
jgi:hypothetical protein